jgi:hypothetical protein
MVSSLPRVPYACERNHFKGCRLHSRALLNTVAEITFPAPSGNTAPLVHLAAIHFIDNSVPVYLQNVFCTKSHE